MIHVANQTKLLWTVADGMGFAVLAVVIVLLTLLLKSASTLDKRVDQVWSAAVGVFVHTLTAAPSLNTAARHTRTIASHQPGTPPGAAGRI
jgi:hypothetical protein